MFGRRMIVLVHEQCFVYSTRLASIYLFLCFFVGALSPVRSPSRRPSNMPLFTLHTPYAPLPPSFFFFDCCCCCSPLYRFLPVMAAVVFFILLFCAFFFFFSIIGQKHANQKRPRRKKKQTFTEIQRGADAASPQGRLAEGSSFCRQGQAQESCFGHGLVSLSHRRR